MNTIPGKVLQFIKTKEYTFQRNIGQGGTGKTILVKDEVTGIDFVCKKYSPYDLNRKEEYFSRFIDEIKIMYLLSHQNIVRIYNYFLYPENTTGYILMEYINGTTIDDYLTWQFNEVYENIFIQLIDGFEYLEKNNVLHRDIRNANILVTNDGIVKIIDFGFGKKIECEAEENASILLNWPVSELPEEISNYQYNHQTEIYFVGKLFNRILEENEIEDFRYQHIIDKMIISNPQKRIKSFSEVLQVMSEDIFEDLEFTEEEKSIYCTFANSLVLHLSYMRNDFTPIYEPKDVINLLENLIRDCLIEEVLQDNSKLISCFIKNNYYYNSRKDIEIQDIRNFYKFIKKQNLIKQKIILNSIITRLGTIPIKPDEDELPF